VLPAMRKSAKMAATRGVMEAIHGAVWLSGRSGRIRLDQAGELSEWVLNGLRGQELDKRFDPCWRDYVDCDPR
jgi:hypothetical protein